MSSCAYCGKPQARRGRYVTTATWLWVLLGCAAVWALLVGAVWWAL